jgi:hypothetical protein
MSMSLQGALGKLYFNPTGKQLMVFDSADDVKTLKNIGVNVLLLVGVMVSLIVLAVVIG